jgi:hypothetical protein
MSARPQAAEAGRRKIGTTLDGRAICRSCGETASVDVCGYTDPITLVHKPGCPYDPVKAGRKGGRARSKALSPSKRRAIAREGAAARWRKEKP